ncbi:MAG: SDR family NAD(P)-dependent oxidoreductase [Bdellovibrionales bacterium]|nr:SDR family NAD(P)-dependent oxidoreductase [Bdellovibrionales bacterium]NQZ17655.1 SDR family NAD(P)-dependent oxidoreductase [Bdellovibrionales bacterium]
MIFDISEKRNALIIGAGHGIGWGLCLRLLESYPNITVYATYRNKDKYEPLKTLKEKYSERLKIFQIDPTLENDLVQLKDEFQKDYNEMDLLINSVGLLHDDSLQPEKSLRDINPDTLLSTYLVNAVVTPLLAKHFFSLFKNKTPSAFVGISAKVGSIEDNRMGGWYSYRASKSAMNMFLKNISIEMARYRCHTLVLSIHPGTTITELSKPFTKNTPYQLHEPEDTARNILNVINLKNLDETGSFYTWDNNKIPW